MSVSGFNKDVSYGLPDTNGTAIVGIDNVFSFYQTSYISPTGTLNAGTEFTTGGLDDQNITSAVGGAGTPFTLQSFTANNVMQFNQGSTGTLTLKTPAVFTKLAVLATSSFANEDTPNVTIHFSDGTSAISCSTNRARYCFGVTRVSLPSTPNRLNCPVSFTRI